MSATDKEMAPEAHAEAYRRREDAMIVYQAWYRENAKHFVNRPDDLVKGWKTFALQKAMQWAQKNPDTRELFEITLAEKERFKKQWVSQTRRLRYGSVDSVSEAEWKAQMEAIENEYWPKKQAQEAA